METKYQTSFIPKKPITEAGSSKTAGGMNFFLLVSIVVFLISLGLGGWVYLEKKLLLQSIAKEKATIEQNRTGLIDNSITIENLVILNSRINVAKQLLAKHVAVSPIFNFLQQTTLKSVRFKNFSFNSNTKGLSGQTGVGVIMSGIASDWETVASQADEFGKPAYKQYISEPKISNLSLNTDGTVSFSFSAFITPQFLVYGNNNTTSQ